MRNNRKNIIIAIFSIFLSVAGVLTLLLFWPFLNKSVADGLNVKIISVWNLLLFIAMGLLIYPLLCRIEQMTGRLKLYGADNDDGGYNKCFWKFFALMIACWSIWFWLYFPGVGMNDTINCIITFRNDNQTLPYQLFIYYGIHGLMALTHSMKAAYAILTVLQMVVMALVISRIAVWLCRRHIRKKLVWFFVTYYALMPVIADYSITLVKDTLFGVCVMASIPLIYELVQNNGEAVRNRRFCAAFVVDLLGISVLRSNGKYIAVILVIVLICISLKRHYERYLLCMLAILLTVNAGIGLGEKALIPTEAGFREAIGVPLVQIGAVLTTNGTIRMQDSETLAQLLPLETWKENTRLSLADPIKFDEKFDNQWLNDHKGAFIGAWFSVFRDNPAVYIKSYLCHTYGFWNISPASGLLVNYNQSYFTEINNNTDDDSFWAEFCVANSLLNSEIAHGTVREVLHLVLKVAFAANMALGAGIMLWICVWFVVELVIYKKYKVCCVFLPTMLCWGTMMIAAPASFIYRYSFYLVLSLPVFFLVMMMQLGGERRGEQANDLTENIVE